VRFEGLAVGCSACFAVGCTSLVGTYEPDLELIDPAPLCAIERDAFAFDIDMDSDDALPDLESYYAAANPDFVEHLANVHQDYVDDEQTGSVTYLMGAAGVGKSFVLDSAVSAFADDEVCEIAISEWYEEKSATLSYEVSSAPDLATLDGDTVFNELAAHSDPSAFDLVDLLEAAGCYSDGALTPMVVIDGIDEIHDDAADQILEAVDKFVIEGKAGGFVHFLVSGRPEGFWSWLTNPERDQRSTAIVESFDLIPPRYATAGDLDFRIRGYLDFTDQLVDLEASHEIDAYVASVTATIAAHPFLTYSTGNLAVGNVVIEQTAPGLDQNEHELKSGLFDDILLRDADTHGRPGNGGALDGAYRRVLEQIAARYAPEVDDLGVFTTRSNDVIPVTDDEGNHLGEVRVRDVLNRGGVAFLTSATNRTHRYRFDPFWLQSHLVERHNASRYPGYDYRGCD